MAFRYEHPTKGLRWLEGTSLPAREADGSVIWHGYVADATEPRRAEEALRRSEEQFRHLADAMPQLVWTNRPDGSAEFYNRHWREFTGTTPGDVQGDDWSRLLHPDNLQRTLQRWHRSLASGEPYEIEYRLRSARDGTHRWFLARALPVRDDAGHVIRWFGTCTDIHEQKRVEDELLAKRAVDESSIDCARSSPQGRVPGDALPRAAQPARADPELGLHPAPRRARQASRRVARWT